MALQQLMLAVVSASDAIMLNLISQEKMSAVSLATQVTFVENLFLAAMTIGLSMFAAQYYGKKDIDAVEQIFSYVMKITATVSFLFFIAAFFFSDVLMRLFTDESVLIEGGAQYLRLVSPSYFLTGIAQIYLCLFKNTEKAKKATIISSTCMIGDMLMNAILIVGLFRLPRLEIAGAALSTTISSAIQLIWCIAESGSVKLRFSTATYLHRDFWEYTMPVLGNELVWGIGFTMYSVMMGHMGTDAVAANSIANIVKNLVSCFCLGLGSGGGVLIGNTLGRGELETAKRYGDRLCKLSIISGALSGVILLCLSPLIVSLTGLGGNATAYLRGMLVICSYYMIGKSINGTTIAGIFCAGGDSRFGFICDTVTMWCITVPLGFLAAFVLDLPVVAVYFIVSLDEMVKLPAVYKNYKKYNWVKDLTRRNIIWQ